MRKRMVELAKLKESFSLTERNQLFWTCVSDLLDLGSDLYDLKIHSPNSNVLDWA